MRYLANLVHAALAYCLLATAPQALTVVADQGQIFDTGGDLELGTTLNSQSVTTGVAGQLLGIEVQFHTFQEDSSYPSVTTIPTIEFAVYSGDNPVSGTALYSKVYSFDLSDFTSEGLYTFDLLAGNLIFDVDDVFTFSFQASETGLNWAGNDPPGYDGGVLFVDGAPLDLSDIAFISYVDPTVPPAPIPLPAGLPLYGGAVFLLGGLGLQFRKVRS